MKLKRTLLCLLAAACVSVSAAQTSGQSAADGQAEQLRQLLNHLPQLPLDSAVRKGVLPNGLTYYIRHNEWPADRAFFYIAQNVGSMQEEDSQRGLAHFLEHICFNGTTHFPGDNVKTFLERHGVKYGENLNAYTSFDETVYNIDNVKTDDESVLDSCLLILHDWSHDLLLLDSEIEKERGVINEEWRLRRSASQRLYEAALPDIYPGSKYADRMPIGTMEVVMNFHPDTLRAYYRKWYRPDQQAVVVVGDIDVERMEQKIQALFADIKTVEDAAPRVFYPVPDNYEPLVSIHSDKEQTHNQIFLFRKHETTPRALRNTMVGVTQGLVNEAISSMFRERVAEILQKGNPPFINAVAEDGEFFVSKTEDAFTGLVVFKDNGQQEALSAFYRELLRVGRHGFTVSEYQRFQQNFLADLEDRYSKRDRVESVDYVDECVRNFLDGEPITGVQWDYENLKTIAPGIPLEAVNQCVKDYLAESDTNLVVVMFAPEKDDVALPTRQELLDILHAVEAETIEPYQEEVSDQPLVTAKLKGSKVKKREAGDYGSTTLTLKNGVRIHVKQTDFSPNSISMEALSWGGSSLYPDSDYLNADNADMVTQGGLGGFSQSALTKRLAGKTADVEPSVGNRDEKVSGSCVTKDLETMLQLTYLTFTSPRRDDAAYAAYLQRVRQSLQNLEMNPYAALNDSIASTFFDNDLRARRLKADDLDKFDYDRMLQIYSERFADGDDFEFFLVGDIDLSAATPLLEKYLGSLPTLKGAEQYRDISRRMADGERVNVFERAQQTPNSFSIYRYHAHMPYGQESKLRVNMLGQVLQARFLDSVREEQGGAYAIPTSGSMSDWPEEVANVTIQLPTSPEKRASLEPIIERGIADICKQPPTEEELQKVKEYMLRAHQEDLKKNDYWLGALVEKARFGRETVDGYEQIVNATTPDMLRQLAEQIFHSGNRLVVTMTTPPAE